MSVIDPGASPYDEGNVTVKAVRGGGVRDSRDQGDAGRGACEVGQAHASISVR